MSFRGDSLLVCYFPSLVDDNCVVFSHCSGDSVFGECYRLHRADLSLSRSQWSSVPSFKSDANIKRRNWVWSGLQSCIRDLLRLRLNVWEKNIAVSWNVMWMVRGTVLVNRNVKRLESVDQYYSSLISIAKSRCGLPYCSLSRGCAVLNFRGCRIWQCCHEYLIVSRRWKPGSAKCWVHGSALARWIQSDVWRIRSWAQLVR